MNPAIAASPLEVSRAGMRPGKKRRKAAAHATTREAVVPVIDAVSWRLRLLQRRAGGWRCRAVIVLVGGALWLIASAGWIGMKATLAQYLIGSAWAASGVHGEVVKPWPWADTWPVARLKVPRLGQDLYVLAGVSGQALAFGPGFEPASVLPGRPGVSVIAGHRDTHFAFLRDLQPGTLLTVELPGGEPQEYRVTTHHVIDSARESLALYRRGPSRLLLVTCYPFDSLSASGSLRLVISAVATGLPGVGASGSGNAIRAQTAPLIRPRTLSRPLSFFR